MNINAQFFLDVMLIVPAAVLLGRSLYLRSRREGLRRKYKKDPSLSAAVEKMTSVRRLLIAVILLSVLVVKTVFDVRQIFDVYGGAAANQIKFVLSWSGALSLIAFILAYHIFKSKNLIIKP